MQPHPDLLPRPELTAATIRDGRDADAAGFIALIDACWSEYPGCIGKTTAGGRMLDTDGDFVMGLLEEEHVAAVHGGAYGMSPYFRISYATDTESLIEGCKRIARYCAGLK